MRFLATWEWRVLFVDDIYAKRSTLEALFLLIVYSFDPGGSFTKTRCKMASITFETPALFVVVLDDEMAFETFNAKIDCFAL